MFGYSIMRYNFYTHTWVQVSNGSADTKKEAIKIAQTHEAMGGRVQVKDVITGEVIYEGGRK